jgi:thiamine-phosphate pyrophosphorylase
VAEQHEVQRIRPQLYLITPPRIVVSEFADQLRAALSGGEVACLQLRLKDVPDEEVITAAEVLMPICHEHDVALLINDRPDLAEETDADGVHVGQEDASYADARALLGSSRIVGVTCHDSRHLAMEAAEEGADYVAFGAFFPTTTKQPKSTADVNLLQWWDEIMEVPCVAIGGITADNCAALLDAGADFLAVAGGIWDHAEGPKSAVEQFNQAIDQSEADRAAKAKAEKAAAKEARKNT